MKSVANFYSIEENHDINLCICKFVSHLFKKDESIIIIDNNDKLEELDRLLWSFEQNSFLPHKKFRRGEREEISSNSNQIFQLEKRIIWQSCGYYILYILLMENQYSKDFLKGALHEIHSCFGGAKHLCHLNIEPQVYCRMAKILHNFKTL